MTTNAMLRDDPPWPSAELEQFRAEVSRLRAALELARPYVEYVEREGRSLEASELLAEIDAVLGRD